MAEPTYTLEEAERELAKRECAAHGHSWDVIENMAEGPLRIVCVQCGWSGDVTMGDRP